MNLNVLTVSSVNSIDAMAGTLTSYGRLLMDMQRFELARDMFERCVEQRRGDQDLRNLCRSELQLADCLFVYVHFVLFPFS